MDCVYGEISHEPKKPHHHEHHNEHHHEHSHHHRHHEHAHHHEHSHIAGKNKKALLLSFIVTLVVMFAELIYGYLSHSLALISDALHMVMHAFALILSYFAVLATSFKDSKKTYGYHRAEIIAAFINAVLIALLVIFIVYEAIEKLITPEEIDVKTMLIVSAFGLFANIVSALLLMNADMENINVKSSFLHMLGDLFSSVAIIIGGIVVYYTDYYFIDTLLALIIAFVIAKWSWSLFKQSLNILLESSHIEIEHLKEYVLSKHDKILDIHDIHVVSIAQDFHVLTAHVLIDKDMVLEFKSLVDELSKSLEHEFNITHITIQPEWH